MNTIPLKQLISFSSSFCNDAVFAVSATPFDDGKSTFLHVFEPTISHEKMICWGSPTPIYRSNFDAYQPYFLMAALSTTPFTNSLHDDPLNELQLPEITFTTHPDIRRSMTLNAMRMGTELLETGSDRVFELVQNRLSLGQTDVVHDLMVYLMHAIVDERRSFVAECTLRAESIAAYLGISPSKVLLLLHRNHDNAEALITALQQGHAGTIQRNIDLTSLIQNQLQLLKPHYQYAKTQEIYLQGYLCRVMDLWV